MGRASWGGSLPLAGIAGFEPANAGVKVLCLNRLGYIPVWSCAENEYTTIRAVCQERNASYRRKPQWCWMVSACGNEMAVFARHNSTKNANMGFKKRFLRMYDRKYIFFSRKAQYFVHKQNVNAVFAVCVSFFLTPNAAVQRWGKRKNGLRFFPLPLTPNAAARRWALKGGYFAYFFFNLMPCAGFAGAGHKKGMFSEFFSFTACMFCGAGSSGDAEAQGVRRVAAYPPSRNRNKGCQTAAFIPVANVL